MDKKTKDSTRKWQLSTSPFGNGGNQTCVNGWECVDLIRPKSTVPFCYHPPAPNLATQKANIQISAGPVLEDACSVLQTHLFVLQVMRQNGKNMNGDAGNETPSPHELFYYAAKHQVLICIPCQYAIQPAAVARHLKEIHHIYRRKRDPFILFAKKLKLRNPDDVTPPAAKDFPVPHIPVEQGWHCTHYSACKYMCVSTKRMQLHWSAQHGRKCDPDLDMESVPLQTFFRGNSLRYFTNNEIKRHALSLVTPFITQLESKHGLDQMDQTLFKHYFNSAYKSFVTSKQTETVWLQVVPPLADEHTFLLHGMLACSALHMAYLHPLQRQQYTIRACAHQDIAIPLFKEAVDNPTEKNCDAIVAFAYLLVVYSFATDGETSHNSLLLINDGVAGKDKATLIIPQWLHFIRAGCCMLCDVWKRIENGPVSMLAMAWEVEMDMGDDELPYLNHFFSIIPDDSSWTADAIEIYRSSAINLAKSFAYMNKVGMDSGVSTWSILGMWPVSIDAGYMDLLYERHPGALILLAYYCIILKQMQERWYFAGRASKLMASIVSLLDPEWQACIDEAVRIVEEQDV